MGRKSYSSRTETRALERGTKPSSYAERTTAQKALAFALALILTVESLFNNGMSTAFAETLADGLGNQPGTEQVDDNVDGQKDNNTDPDDPTDLNDPENTNEPGDPKDPSDSSDPTDSNKGSEPNNAEKGDGDTNISDPNKDETPDPNTTTETEAETSAETSDPNKTDTSDPVEPETPDPNTTQTETPDPNTTQTETPDPNTAETETPDPNTTTETDADSVEVETWDWTGKTDNLTLSSPDGLAFDTEALKAIVDEAQATTDNSEDEAEANAGDETEADSEDTTDQTDNAIDQTENDQTTNEADTTTPADVLRTLLSEQLDATLDLTFQLNPSVDDVDTGNHTVVLPGDSFTVTLPEGMTISDQMVDNDKHSFDIFQSDEEGNPTTLKIAEGTIENEGTMLKVTFMEPVETADTENTTAYYVGNPTEGTVPAAQTEGKEQIEKLDASIDLKVAVKAELLTDEASELTWTLQTKADDENVKQEATLVLPGMAELADQLGVVVPAPEEPQEQEDEKDDQTDDETATDISSLSSINGLLPLVNASDESKPDDNGAKSPENFNASLTIKTTWADNNESDRPSTDTLQAGYKLYFTINGTEYVYTADNAEMQLGWKDNPPAVSLAASMVNEYTASVSGLPTSVTEIGYEQKTDDEGNKLYDTETGEPLWERKDVTCEVTWRLVDENEYSSDSYFRSGAPEVATTAGSDVVTANQTFQKLAEQTFNIVGKIGNEEFEELGKKTGEYLFLQAVVDNKRVEGMRFEVGKITDQSSINTDLGGGLNWNPSDDDSNSGILSGNLPRYTVDGKPIEYRLEYTGGDETPVGGYKDYYAATFNNSASSNHGSDTTHAYNNGTVTLTHTGTTSFDATKQWLDNSNADNARPDEEITFTLWRYSNNGSAATASQVADNAGAFVTITFNPSKIEGNTVDLGALLLEQHEGLSLPKYDSDGYPFVYGVREETVPEDYETVLGSVDSDGNVTTTKPNYYNADRTETEVFDDGYTRPTTDRLTYNGGTVSNRLEETITVEQVKTWKVDAFADQLKDVTCEFTLQRRPEGVEDAEWETVRTQELNGFTAEQLSQTISSEEERYDKLGREYEYRWVETDVKQGGAETNFKASEDGTEATFTLSLKSTEGNSETTDSVVFTSTVDEETGEIVNSFDNTTDEYVEKLWQQPELDDNGDPVYDRKQPDKTRADKVTVTLYQGSNKVGSYTLDGIVDEQATVITNKDLGISGPTVQETSPYYLEILDLPLYTESGGRYTYRVVEEPVEGWHTVREYDAEGHLTMFRNSYGPGEATEFHITKDWVDGDDSAHRLTCVVEVRAARDLTTKDGETTFKEGHVFTEVKLSESNAWFYEVSIPVGDLKTSDLDIVETKLVDVDGTEYEVMTYSEAVAWSNTQPADYDASWINTAWNDDYINADNERVATNDHVYEVTYTDSKDQPGPFGKQLLSVSNRRIGLIDLSVEKTWLDEGADKEKRPEANFELTVDDAGAVFSVNKDTDQAFVQLTNGNNIPLFSNEAGNQPLTGATVKDGGKTLVVPVDRSGDSGEKNVTYIYGLPKYTGDGVVVHYSVSEEWVGNHGDYEKSVTEDAYEIGNRHFHDKQTFSAENKRQGTTEVQFYKEWNDTYTYESGSRPDIYLTLYRRGSDGKLESVDGYVHFLWEPNEEAAQDHQGGTSSNLAAQYDQICKITGLQKYDESGYEYEYFASETMSSDGTSLGYAPVEFKGYAGATLGKGDVVDTETGDDADVTSTGSDYAVRSGNVFVNSLTGELEVNGEKLWTNIPGNYDLSDLELPKVTVFIQRRYVGEEWPELYVDYDEETQSLTPRTGAVAYQDGLTPDKDDPKRFTFNITEDIDGEKLPRYDSEGKIYEYRAIEVITGLIGSDASMAIEQIEETNFADDEHVAEDGEQVYDIRHGVTGSFFITNAFNPTEGNLTVKKFFTGDRASGDKYPDITYTLYRRYDRDGSEKPGGILEGLISFFTGGAGETMSKPEKVTSVTLTGEEIAQKVDQSGSFTYTFDGLDMWAPNGSDYEYYVVESTIDGYTTTVVLGNANSELDVTDEPVTAPNGTDVEGACSPAAVDTNGNSVVAKDDTRPDITFANKYDYEKLELTGSKKWDDYGDAFNVRLTTKDITLTVKRTSDSGQVEELTEGEGYELKWTFTTGDEWSYTISGLEQWAPDGSAWNYEVTESLIPAAADFYRIIDGTAKGEGTKEGAEGSWTGSLDDLENGLKGSAEVEKKWYGVGADGNPVQNADDEWGFRPKSVEVELQARYRTGENDPWSAWLNASDAFTTALGSGFSLTGFDATQTLDEDGGWDYQWNTVPIFAKRSAGDSTLYEFQYRVIETKVGDTGINIAKQDDGAIQYAPQAESYVGTSETTLNDDSGMLSSTLVENFLLTTDLKVTKVWDDDDNIWGLRDEAFDQYHNPIWTVTYQLQVSSDDGKTWTEVKNATGQISHDVTGSLTEGAETFNTNSYTFRNLPAYDKKGNELIYRAVEAVPGGYDVTGALSENVGEGNAVVDFDRVEGSEERSQTYTNTLFTTELEGTKAWDDYGTGLKPSLPSDGSVPSVKMTLERSNDDGKTWERATYDDGTLMQPAWSDANNDGVWEWEYTGLPGKDGEGNTYEYRASEDEGSVPGFYPTVDKDYSKDITNVATRFTLDKVSDSKDKDKDEVNDVELSVMSTNKQTVYAVWKRDASGNETSFVWQNGKAASEVWTGGNIKSGSADTTGAVEMKDTNAGYIVGLKAGTYKIVETGELPEGYARAADTNLTIGKDGSVNSTKPGENAEEITVTDQVFDGYFTFTKALGTADGKKLEGVTFYLYRVNDDGSEVLLAKGLTTDANGVFDSSKATDVEFEDGVDLGVGGDERKSLADGLQAGSYYLLETTTTDDAYYPSGDELKFPFTIDQETNHGAANKVTVKDNATSNPGNTLLNTPFQVTVSLPKYDADAENKAAISDAEFKLQYHNGKDWVDVATGLKTDKSYTLTLDDGNGYKAAGADKPANGTAGVLQLTLNMKGEYRLVETANQGYEVPVNDGEKFVVTFELENVDHDTEFVYSLADANVQTDGTAKGQLGAAAENFKLDANGVPNERLTGKATLTKTDDEGNVLQGVVFSLQKEVAGDVWTDVKTSLTTDGNGQITVDDLEWGTYRFVETGVKDGYVGHVNDKPVTSQEFTISRTTVESEQRVTAENAATRLRIKKTDASGNVLSGKAAFVIEGELANGEDSVTVSTVNGVAELRDALLIAGKPYTLRETEAPAGYELAGSVTFTVDKNGNVVNPGTATGGSGSYAVSKDGGINLTTATDTQISITLEKDGNKPQTSSVVNPYADAEFTISGTFVDGTQLDGNRNLVKRTDENGKIDLTGVLIANETYVLTETKAPKGYELIEGSLVFKVKPDGTIETMGQVPVGYGVIGDSLVIKATDPSIEVSLAKVDENGKLLAGVTFEITPKEGSAWADGTTGTRVFANNDATAYSIDSASLVAGNTYVLSEVVAPNGYEIAGKVEFTVGDDGTVTLGTHTGGTGDYAVSEDAASGVVTITATDKQTSVTLIKVSTNGGAQLPGAEFTLEPASQSGSFANTDLNNDGKSDLTADGKLELTSGSNGEIVLIGVLNGGQSYKLTETKAPAGYELSANPTFTFDVVKDGTISPAAGQDVVAQGEEGFSVASGTEITLTIADEPIEAKILKQDKGGETLKGASFTLSGTLANGQTIVTVHDDDDGTEDGIIEIASALLVAGGDYTIEEIVAPDGHEVAGKATLHVNDDGAITVQAASDGSGEYVSAESKDGVAVITVKDEQIALELEKVGTDGATNLDATFTIKPVTGSSFKTADKNDGIDVTPSTAADKTRGELLERNTYTITEKDPADGYQLNKGEFAFTVNDDGTISAAIGETEDAAGTVGYRITNNGIQITATDVWRGLLDRSGRGQQVCQVRGT